VTATTVKSHNFIIEFELDLSVSVYSKFSIKVCIYNISPGILFGNAFVVE